MKAEEHADLIIAYGSMAGLNMSDQDGINSIIDNISNGNNPFEEKAIHNQDLPNLFYSCVLDEQRQQGMPLSLIEKYWRKELSAGKNFLNLCNRMKLYKESYYPTGIAIENNTICNAKCTNCTHEKLISDGSRPSVNVPLDTMRYRIRKAKLIYRLFNPDCPNYYLDLTGFGEPLLNPYMLDELEYAKFFFDGIELTSNASLLNKEWLEQYFKLNTRRFNLSLSYFDKHVYEREIGLPYERTIENIRNAFIIRNRMQSKTSLSVHIFDNRFNVERDVKEFKALFEAYKRDDDLIYTRNYDEAVENGLQTRNKKRDDLVPCFMLWTTFMIDVMGNVFPCCHCGWVEFDQEMSLGRIEDDPETILNNVLSIRRKQKEGHFGRTCLECPILYEEHVGDYIHVKFPEQLSGFLTKYQKVFLYGAGGVGAKMCRLLSRENISFVGFLETQTMRTMFLEHPVTNLDSFSPDGHTGVIITVGNKIMADEMKEKLMNTGLLEEQIYVQSIFS